MAKDGYYYFSGKKDADKLIFVPLAFKNRTEAESFLKAKLEKKESDDIDQRIKKAKGRNVVLDKKIATIKEKIPISQSPNKLIKKLNTAESEYNKNKDIINNLSTVFASNIKYYEEVNGGMPLEEMLAHNKAGTGDFIADVYEFNKRMQILATMNDKPLSPFIMGKETLNTVIINAIPKDISNKFGISLKVLENRKKKTIKTDIHLDGVVEVLPENFDNIIYDGGHQKGSWIAKGILKTATRDNGLMMGKYAYFKVDAATAKEMRKNGIDMKIYDTAAKQKGVRTSYDWNMRKSGMIYSLKGKKTDPILYEIPTRDFTVNTGTNENLEMMDGLQKIKRHFLWNPNYEQMGDGYNEIRNYFNSSVRKSILGKKEYNDLLRKHQSEEKVDLDQIDFDFVDLKQVIDIAIGKQQNNPQLYEKVWKHIRKDFEKYEEIAEDGKAYQGYLEELYENRDINQVILEAGGYKPHTVLHKLNHRVNTTQLSSYIFKRIISPTVEYSGYSIGAPFTPYMAFQGMKLEKGKFYLGNGAKKKIIKVRQSWNPDKETGEYKTNDVTIERAWETLQKLENPDNLLIEKRGINSIKAAAKRLKRDMRFAIMRSPSSSVSGTRILEFAGFLEQGGYQMVLHPYDMTYLGGMDLDIDSVTWYQGLPNKAKDALVKVQKEWETSDGYLKMPKEKIDIDNYTIKSPDYYKSTMAMFDPDVRADVSYEAAATKSKVGWVNNRRYAMNTILDAIDSNNGKLVNDAFIKKESGDIEQVGKIIFTANPNRKKLRELLDDLSHLAADAGDGLNLKSHSAWEPAENLLLDVYDAAFSKIELRLNDTNKSVDLLQQAHYKGKLKKVLNDYLEFTDLGKHNKLISLFGTRNYDTGSKYNLFDYMDGGLDAKGLYGKFSNTQLDQFRVFNELAVELDPRMTLNSKNYIDAIAMLDKGIQKLTDSGLTEIAKSIRKRLNIIRSDKYFEKQIELMTKPNISNSQKYIHYQNAIDMMHNDIHMAVNTLDVLEYVKKIQKKGVNLSDIQAVSNKAHKDIELVHNYFLSGQEISIEQRNYSLKHGALDAQLQQMVGFKNGLPEILRPLYEKELLNSFFTEPATNTKGKGLKLKAYMFRRQDLVSLDTIKNYFNKLNEFIARPKAKAPKPMPEIKNPADLIKQDNNLPELKDTSTKKEAPKVELTTKEKNLEKIRKSKETQEEPVKKDELDINDTLNEMMFPDNPQNKSNGIKTVEDAHAVSNKATEPKELEELSKQYVKIAFLKEKKPNESLKRLLEDDTMDLSSESKDLQRRLNSLFQWNSTLAKNINDIFSGYTGIISEGAVTTGRNIEMATMSDLRGFIDYMEAIRMSKHENVKIRDFITFPESVKERLEKFGDVEFYTKHAMKVMTKDGLITQDVKIPISHMGILQNTANLFIDGYASNKTNELQNELVRVFEDVIKNPDGIDLLKIAISRYEIGEMNNPDGTARTGERYHLYRDNYEKWNKIFEEKYKGTKIPKHIKDKVVSVDAETMISDIQKRYINWYKDFYNNQIRTIKGYNKDGTPIFKNDSKQFEFKDSFMVDKEGNRLIDLDKAIPKIIESFEKGNPIDLKMQSLYDVGWELKLSLEPVVYDRKKIQVIDLLSGKKETHKRRMRLYRSRMADLKEKYKDYKPEIGWVKHYFPHGGHPKKIVERFKAAERRKLQQAGATDADIAKAMLDIDTKVGMTVQDDGFRSRPFVEMINQAGFPSTTQKSFERLGVNQRPSHAQSRSKQGPMPEWDISIDAVNNYVSQIIKAKGNILFSLGAVRNIQHFSKEKRMGKYTDNWSMFMKLYSRGVVGYPSIIPQEYHDKSDFPTERNPFVWLSDQTMAKKMNKIADKYFNGKKGWESDNDLYQKIAHFSTLEAKYELMSLLSHSKTGITNLGFGSVNTMISAGFNPWKKAQNFKWIQDNIPRDENGNKFESKDDLEKWVEIHGATESWITEMARKVPVFRTGKMKSFLNDVTKAIKKDPEMNDFSLMEIAKRHGISKSIVDGAAFFMRKSERKLRRDAFVAHYIQAMNVLNAKGVSFKRNDPWLIDIAKAGVKTTQFLYSNANRPVFSATNLGRMYSRFQLFAWNSVRFRNQLRKMAAKQGWNPNSKDMQRFGRLVTADMIAFALAQAFVMSIFDAGLPPPYQWFQDSATLLFGDEKSRDRAFFGTLPGPLAPLQAIAPPGSRLLLQPLGNLLKNDWSDFSAYQAWTWFPFGRITRDAVKLIDNPVMAIERITGFPLHGIQRYKKKQEKLNEESEIKLAA